MSVLIKGMEAPTSCRECPFRRETYLLTRQLCAANNNEEICEGIDKVDKSCPLYDFWLSDDEVNATIQFLNEQTTIIPAEEVYGKYTDTVGNMHWTGTRSGEHVLR